MNRMLALSLFLATCLILATLLLVRAIKPVVSGIIFAIALVVFGGLSRGFRASGGSQDQ
jgi:hypothetical protein